MPRHLQALVIFFVTLVGLAGMWPSHAQATSPNMINFQGKVVNNVTGNVGTNVADGSYTFRFRLYTSTYPTDATNTCSANSCLWETTRTLTVTNGVFQVELGDTGQGDPALPDFNANSTVYLGIKFNNDAAGEMNPRVHLDSVPYALNSDKLGGLGNSAFTQLAQGLQTDTSTTNPSIYINKNNASGSPNILQLQKGGVDVFTIGNTGLATAAQGLTIASAKSLTVNGDVFTDLTGNGLAISSNALTINLAAAAAGGLTANTSSGSGLEVLGQGLALLQGCADTQILKWVDATGLWNCAADVGGSVAANSLDFTSFKDAMTLDATTSIGFGGASNFGLTFTNDGSANMTINLASTGDFVVQDNGAPVLTVSDTGTLLFKNSTASATAFQIQNSSGVVINNINTSATANVVSNPSFEQNTNGWIKKGAAGVTLASSDEVTAQYGSRELKIVTTAAIGDGATFNFTPAASTVYSVSFWAKSTGTTTANISFGHRENTTTGDVDCSANNVITTTWAQFTCSNFTTNAAVNDTPPTIGIYVKQSDATVRTIYIDGVTMTPAAAALTFDAGGDNLNIQSLNSNIYLNNKNTGELQPWQTNSNSLPNARDQAASVVANGYLYVLGGYDNGTSTAANSVYYAKMNADGSLGTFASSGIMPTGARYLAATVANGYIYAVGGATTAGVSSSNIYYAKLNADGSVGTWQTNSVPLPVARYAASVVVSNGILYVLGGCTGNDASVNCATPSNLNYYGKLNADGSVQGVTASNALTQSSQNLPAARGMGSAVFANGYIYYVGGYNATIQSTVNYAAVNAGGDLVSWSTSGASPSPPNLTAARREHTLAVANGYLYVVGGCSAVTTGVCSTAANTTYYAKLNNDGTWGTWTQNANNLPTAKAMHASAIANGYVYVLGGYDGATHSLTNYYASTARVLIGGSLDLLGLSGQSLTDFGGGGALTAGNTRVIGDLKVDGFADFNNGISVDSVINLNSVSGTLGQKIFNINNSSSNSIFNIQHMGSNFGATASTGAFISKNSYWGEEFNNIQTTACSRTATLNVQKVRSDNANNPAACTAATTYTGDLSFSSVIANATAPLPTSAACSSSVTCGGGAVSSAYGQERISAVGNTGASQTVSSLEYMSTGTAGTINPHWTANNLPIFTAKVKPSLTASGSNARFFVGLGDKGAASGLFPTNGIFFSNCTVTGTPACAGTNWIGVVTTTAGGVVGTVTCNTGLDNSNNINTANFNYLRIEVRSNTDIHFFVDTDTSNGINEKECGAGISGTGPAATGLTLQLESAFMTATATTENLDVDYVRVWQDDPPADSQAPAETSTPPLVADSVSPGAPDPSSTLFDFLTATSEDMVFSRDVYVKGTLYADKVKANQIEGLEIFTDQLNSLRQQLAKDKPPESQPTTASALPTASSSSGLDLNNLLVQSAVIALRLDVNGKLTVNGGLTVNDSAQFHGETSFQKFVSFMDRVVFRKDVSIEGRVTFNKDTGGFAIIPAGQDHVDIKFDKPFDQLPVVTVNIKDGQFLTFAYKTLKPESFTITLPKPAGQDTEFAWTAFSVKDAATTRQAETTN